MNLTFRQFKRHGFHAARWQMFGIFLTVLSLVTICCLAGQGIEKKKLECKSKDYRRTVCPVGAPIEALRLAKRKSDSPCVEGESFGFSNQSVWVDKGCAGDFEVTYQVESVNLPDPDDDDDRPWWEDLGSSNAEVTQLRCTSENYGRNICPAGGRIRAVDLRKQRSRAECKEGVSFGFYDDFVWVDKGCEADFEVRYTPDSGWGSTPGGRPPRPETEKVRFTCKSDDYKVGVCYLDGPIIDVRLRKTKSRAPCNRNDSYGFRKDVLWVDKGCEGEFEVTFRLDGYGSSDAGYSNSRPRNRSLSCKSSNYRRKRCDVGGIISAIRLKKTKSRAPCNADSSYGFEWDEIWVDEGCEGEFEVTYFPRP